MGETVLLVDKDNLIYSRIKDNFQGHPFFKLVNTNSIQKAYLDLNMLGENISTVILYCNEEIKEETFAFIETIRKINTSAIIIIVTNDESAVKDKRVIDLYVNDLVDYPFKPNFFMSKLILHLSKRTRCSHTRGNIEKVITEKYNFRMAEIQKELTRVKKVIGNG